MEPWCRHNPGSAPSKLNRLAGRHHTVDNGTLVSPVHGVEMSGGQIAFLLSFRQASQGAVVEAGFLASSRDEPGGWGGRFSGATGAEQVGEADTWAKPFLNRLH